MINMLKRHEIQVFRRAGHTLAEVAAPQRRVDRDGPASGGRGRGHHRR